VEYEPKPPCAEVMFPGKLEGNSGKDRSQRSNFIADAYTNAEIIAMFDAEVSVVCVYTCAAWAYFFAFELCGVLLLFVQRLRCTSARGELSL